MEEVRRSRGRPKKPDHQKVRFVGMKLAPALIQELQKIPGQGMGRKVRFLFSEYQRLKHKENKQLNLLIELMKKFESESSKKHKESLSKQIQILLRVQAQEFSQLKLSLTPEQRRLLTAILNFDREVLYARDH